MKKLSGGTQVESTSCPQTGIRHEINKAYTEFQTSLGWKGP